MNRHKSFGNGSNPSVRKGNMSALIKEVHAILQDYVHIIKIRTPSLGSTYRAGGRKYRPRELAPGFARFGESGSSGPGL